MNPSYRFNRLELAGSLGDLGTLLPLAIGMILINGLNAAGLFFSIGVFYVVAGAYYRITVPVQPMKVIGAYALATGIPADQITAAGLLMGVVLLVLGLTGAITLLGKYTPKSVIRGVQLSTGALLMAEGVRFMLGTSKFQILAGMGEPHLVAQSLGPIPIGLIIGVTGGIMAFLLLDNPRLPAGLAVVAGGLILGLILGDGQGLAQLELGLNPPPWLPFGLPSLKVLTLALLVLVLPQTPMTLGNAVIANADLSKEYFGPDSSRVTYRSLCIGMGLANFMAFAFGGMPLCHGAGGLAAHYRFGARTAGSNLMIGGVFLALAVFLGSSAVGVLMLLPLAVLGVLLLFAGGQLALTLIDLRERKDLFVALLILGITLASNLAAGFIAGMAVAYALKSDRLSV